MQGFFKRYFWTVNLAVLAILAFLSARVVNNIAAGEIMALPTTPKAVAAQTGPARPKGYDPTREWSVTVSDRNLFNSEPPEPEPLAGDGEGEGEGEPERPSGQPPGPGEPCDKSDAPISLLATMVAEPSDWSMAVIDDGDADESRLVKEQQALAERTLVSIQRNRVVLASGGRFECVVLGEPGGKRGRRGKAPTVRPSRATASKTDYKAGINKTGKNSFEIDRGNLNEWLEDLSALSRQARVIPHYRGGKPDGFKVVGVRPGSLYSHIGVRSGDIIKAVGDEEITSPNKALELYEQLKNSDNVTVDIMRRGRKLTLEYDIK